MPSSLFPNFSNRQEDVLSDTVQRTELEFHYLHQGDRLSMAWRRSKSWNRSFMGRKGDYAPRLGLTPADMERKMRDLEQLVGGAVQQRDLAKTALSTFAADLDRTVAEIARIVGQREAERNAIPELLVDLKEQVSAWRRL